MMLHILVGTVLYDLMGWWCIPVCLASHFVLDTVCWFHPPGMEWPWGATSSARISRGRRVLERVQSVVMDEWQYDQHATGFYLVQHRERICRVASNLIHVYVVDWLRLGKQLLWWGNVAALVLVVFVRPLAGGGWLTWQHLVCASVAWFGLPLPFLMWDYAWVWRLIHAPSQVRFDHWNLHRYQWMFLRWLERTFGFTKQDWLPAVAWEVGPMLYLAVLML